MSIDFPKLKPASQVIRARRIEANKRAYLDVVSGLSEHFLCELEHALEQCSEAQTALPEAVEFVLRRVKCIEDADRVVASVCANGAGEPYLTAA